MATTTKTKRKVALKQCQFPVLITDVEGQLTVTVGNVTGNMADELNLREYLEFCGNTYFDFLDSIDVESDIDDEDYEDEEEICPAVPVKRKASPRK